MDGDGYSAAEGDCDDSDGDTYPGAYEACGDGVDNDCEGGDAACPGLYGELDVGEAALKVVGQEAGGAAGYAVAALGDVDGDGMDDFAFGAPYTDGGRGGEVYLGLGAGLGSLEEVRDTSVADAVLSNGYSHAFLGTSITGMGDGNGDGYDDYVVSGGDVPDGVYEELATIYFMAGGSPSGSINPRGSCYNFDADYDHIDSFSRQDQLLRLADPGDVNGDGLGDVIAGSPSYDVQHDDSGAVQIYYGLWGSGGCTTTGPDVILEGGHSDQASGTSVGGGDIDGDGLGDLLVGAPGDRENGNAAGAVFVVLDTPASGTSALGDAGWKLLGRAAADAAGTSVAVAGDTDGDGYAELLIGAPDAGEVYLVSGADVVAAKSASDLSIAHRTLTADASHSPGAGLNAAGDVNNDGFADVVIGAPGAGEDGEGAVYLLYGPLSTGTSALADADTTFTGQASGDALGAALAGPMDVNGDGFDDLLMGAPGESTLASESGAVYLFFGF